MHCLRAFKTIVTGADAQASGRNRACMVMQRNGTEFLSTVPAPGWTPLRWANSSRSGTAWEQLHCEAMRPLHSNIYILKRIPWDLSGGLRLQRGHLRIHSQSWSRFCGCACQCLERIRPRKVGVLRPAAAVAGLRMPAMQGSLRGRASHHDVMPKLHFSIESRIQFM